MHGRGAPPDHHRVFPDHRCCTVEVATPGAGTSALGEALARNGNCHDPDIASQGEEFIRSVLKQTLLALAALHARNITHRDVKPENLLLRNADGEGDGNAEPPSALRVAEPAGGPPPAPGDHGGQPPSACVAPLQNGRVASLHFLLSACLLTGRCRRVRFAAVFNSTGLSLSRGPYSILCLKLELERR